MSLSSSSISSSNQSNGVRSRTRSKLFSSSSRDDDDDQSASSQDDDDSSSMKTRSPATATTESSFFSTSSSSEEDCSSDSDSESCESVSAQQLDAANKRNKRPQQQQQQQLREVDPLLRHLSARPLHLATKRAPKSLRQGIESLIVAESKSGGEQKTAPTVRAPPTPTTEHQSSDDDDDDDDDVANRVNMTNLVAFRLASLLSSIDATLNPDAVLVSTSVILFPKSKACADSYDEAQRKKSRNPTLCAQDDERFYHSVSDGQLLSLAYLTDVGRTEAERRQSKMTNAVAVLEAALMQRGKRVGGRRQREE